MADRKQRDVLNPALSEKVDKERRTIAKALVTGVAFVAPLMASFSKDGLQFSTAMAQGAKKKKATKKKATKKKATKKKATKKKAAKKKAKK